MHRWDAKLYHATPSILLLKRTEEDKMMKKGSGVKIKARRTVADHNNYWQTRLTIRETQCNVLLTINILEQ